MVLREEIKKARRQTVRRKPLGRWQGRGSPEGTRGREVVAVGVGVRG